MLIQPWLASLVCYPWETFDWVITGIQNGSGWPHNQSWSKQLEQSVREIIKLYEEIPLTSQTPLGVVS